MSQEPPSSLGVRLEVDRLVCTLHHAVLQTRRPPWGWGSGVVLLMGMGFALSCVGLLRFATWAFLTAGLAAVAGYRVRNLPLLEDHHDTVVTLSAAGLTLEGPRGTRQLPPHRIGEVRVEASLTECQLILEVRHPPDRLVIGANLHPRADVAWLAKRIREHFPPHPEGDLPEVPEALEDLRRRS